MDVVTFETLKFEDIRKMQRIQVRARYPEICKVARRTQTMFQVRKIKKLYEIFKVVNQKLIDYYYSTSTSNTVG